MIEQMMMRGAALALVANVSLIKLLKMLLRKRSIQRYDETYPADMNDNRSYGGKMNNDELLARINAWDEDYYQAPPVVCALRAVVELIQEKQKFLKNTKGDIPMTNQQLGAREERTKLLAEIKQAIEKELS
jgi:hypothetical protein